MPLAAHPQRPGPNCERLLQRLLAKADRLQQRGMDVSALVTRRPLAIFVASVLCTVIPSKLGWYHVGNEAPALFVAVFAAVACYHNRFEDRLHRLRLWREIKQAHLARVALNGDEVPAKRSPLMDRHPYAIDLDLVGPHSLLHLLDTSVSSNSRKRLSVWLLFQPSILPPGETGRRCSGNSPRCRCLPAASRRSTHTRHSPGLVPLLDIQTGLMAITLLLALILSFAAYALVTCYSPDAAKKSSRKPSTRR